MPGICGIISDPRNIKSSRLVNAMTEIMEHENFYKSGIHSVPEMGICAGWVAMENSFAENPVLFNENKSVALIFSGECFLDSEIGAELKAKGHEISEIKSGWLPHLYEEQGDSFFEKLNGLFSGLLIDRRINKAFLFNDRYGIQRIYFHESDGNFYFASEAKALLRILPKLRKFDAEGVTEFLTFGCTLDWKTIFEGIKILPGGSRWIFENGKCRKEKYFSPENWESQSQLSAAEFENKFQETFKRILPRYFENPKPGIALTGGLDTRMIMACRPQNGERPLCYTFSGNGGEILDDKIAARVAAACGLQHQLLRLGEDFFSDFATHADKTIFVTDGCFGITGTHEIYLNRLAREIAPTRLTGNYGSEVFRGISTFKPLPLSSRLFNNDLREKIDSAATKLIGQKKNPVTFAVFKEIPWNLFGSLAAGRSQVNFRTPYLDNEIVELAYQMPEDIRKSSLPASRLVRNNNVILSEIPTDRGFAGDNSGLKFLLRRIYSEVTFKLDYYNNEGLPDILSPFDPAFRFIGSHLGILGLHKFLRYGSWFRGKLAPFVDEALSQQRVINNSFWNPDFARQMATNHISGQKNYSLEINAMLTLDAIERKLFHDLQHDVETIGKDLSSSISFTSTEEVLQTEKEVLWA